MAEAYHLIGKDDLSRDAVAVLAANFPAYPSLDNQGNFDYQGVSINEDISWLRVITLGLYDSRVPPRYDTRDRYNPALGRTEADNDDDSSDGGRSFLNIITFGLWG